MPRPSTSPSSPLARDLGARIIGGCCSTTPAEIAAIKTAVEEGVESAGATRATSGNDHRLGRGAARDRPRAGTARGRVGGLRPARPAARRLRATASRSGGSAPGLRTGRLRRHQRQRDRPRRHERAHGLGNVERGAGIETIPISRRATGPSWAWSRCCSAPTPRGVRNVLAITGDPPEVGGYQARAASTRSTPSVSRA